MPFSITHIRDLINDQRATLNNGATYIKNIFMKKINVSKQIILGEIVTCPVN